MRRSRVPIVAAAIAVLLWSGLQVAQLRARQQADSIADRLPRADAARSQALLRFARVLRFDRRPDLVAARVAVGGGRRSEAMDLVRRVLAAEPDNILAWTQLGLIARESSPAVFREALREVRRLSPPIS